MTILVINGPNLNLLGEREPELYGRTTLRDLNESLKREAEKSKLTVDFFQSNHEGAVLDRLHAAKKAGVRFIIINPGAWAHTSVALRDALLGIDLPFIEVHLSNIYRREAFRHHSYLADIAVGVISGLGAAGYSAALAYAREFLTETK